MNTWSTRMHEAWFPVAWYQISTPPVWRACSLHNIFLWSESCDTILSNSKVVLPSSSFAMNVAESNEIEVLVVQEILSLVNNFVWAWRFVPLRAALKFVQIRFGSTYISIIIPSCFVVILLDSFCVREWDIKCRRSIDILVSMGHDDITMVVSWLARARTLWLAAWTRAWVGSSSPGFLRLLGFLVLSLSLSSFRHGSCLSKVMSFCHYSVAVWVHGQSRCSSKESKQCCICNFHLVNSLKFGRLITHILRDSKTKVSGS